MARLAFRRYASYRAATIAGILTNTFFGILLGTVMTAVTRERTAVNGYDRQALLTQVWVMQGMLATLAIWGWVDIGDRIHSGDIAIDLNRPVGVQRWWLAHDMGRAAYHALVRGTVPFLIASLLFDLRLPTNWWTPLLFAASLAIANFVSFGLRFLVNVGGFWVHDVRGVNRMAMVLWSALSGMSVSLALFPPHLATVLRALPFAQLMQVPADVWLERHDGPALAGVIALQVAWALALTLGGHWLLLRGTRTAVVHGG